MKWFMNALSTVLVGVAVEDRLECGIARMKTELLMRPDSKRYGISRIERDRWIEIFPDDTVLGDRAIEYGVSLQQNVHVNVDVDLPTDKGRGHAARQVRGGRKDDVGVRVEPDHPVANTVQNELVHLEVDIAVHARTIDGLGHAGSPTEVDLMASALQLIGAGSSRTFEEEQSLRGRSQAP